MDGLAAHLAGWAPDPVRTADRIDRRPADAFAALLDQPSPVTGPGDPLPPLWHWFSFLEHPAQRELGDDGHPAHGHFLPPLAHRRRMVAGGRLEFRTPLWVGMEVVRRSALAAVTPKRGRSGEVVFVTVRHELVADGDVAVVEEQDLAYRSQPPGAERRPAPDPPVAEAPGAAGPWRLRLDPDEALLFRFSALTSNAHRIHYDQPYATGVEGCPGLVVHGPLLALLLLELPRRFAPDRRVGAFDYRLLRPAFAGSPLLAAGGPDGELVAGVPGQPPSITGHVTLIVPRGT